MDDLAERPQSLSRTLDVARGGLMARFAVAGLGGQSLCPDEDGRRSLAAFACAASLFVTVAVAIWAQLTIGWQWSTPNTVATTMAMFIMTARVAVIGAASIACAVPVAYLAHEPCGRSALGHAAPAEPGHRRSHGVDVGYTSFRQRMAGDWWAPVDPSGRRPRWSCCLRLGLHPLPELLLASPGCAEHLPRSGGDVDVRLPARAGCRRRGRGQARPQTRVFRPSPPIRASDGFVVASTMALFLIGAALWIVDGGPGPRDLFHIGAIDVIELAVLVASLALAGRAVECTGDTTRAFARR